MKDKYKIDETVNGIFSDILKAQKITNSNNINFLVALIGARDNMYTTKSGASIIAKFLDPSRYPKTKDVEIINKYKKYQYAFEFLKSTVQRKTNIKTDLIHLHKEIKW
jgi:hypothetical protein